MSSGTSPSPRNPSPPLAATSRKTHLSSHSSPRHIALARIQDLPEDVSFEHLLAELQKEYCIARGLGDFEAGRTLSVQELRHQLAD